MNGDARTAPPVRAATASAVKRPFVVDGGCSDEEERQPSSASGSGGPAANKRRAAATIEVSRFWNEPIGASTPRLSRRFYGVDCQLLARRLLGKILVRRLADGTVLKCRVVETECYLGCDDQASHSFNGRRTERNEPMFMDPGTAYVYIAYGMYHCFNISSEGDGAAVLLRSAVPLQGVDLMRRLRGARRKDAGRKLKLFELCNGPSKLCLAMNITKETLNKEFLPDSQALWLERDSEGDVPAEEIVVSRRVGIEGAGRESAAKPLRFYLRDCDCVSVRDRVAETRSTAQQVVAAALQLPVP
ncbi:uncharacterized protein [Dermacentor andersoni]|uniref:uncharacterized protein n=1 Tax=Dermacentor andersoni TaxID=34620 RepID=UPI002155151A|nr:uncharacterized protein LOC126540278 [Dermacentor andersoni]